MSQLPLALEAEIVFDERGLVPAIAQQHDTGEVLMLAWMNREAIAETLRTGTVCYWSRSRGRLWRKGETSGQSQRLVAFGIDCDGDTLLLKVDQTGVACHTGRRACFFRVLEDGRLVETLKVEIDPERLYGETGADGPGAIAVRLAGAADADLLSRLILAAFEPYRGRLKPESGAFKETPDTVRAQLGSHHLAGLATLDGEPVGCVLFRQNGDDVYLGRLAVLPQFRRRGIARALIHFVEAWAKEAGARSVSLGVRIALADNQRLFEAAGYREIGRTAHPGFNEPTSIDMRKVLD